MGGAGHDRKRDKVKRGSKYTEENYQGKKTEHKCRKLGIWCWGWLTNLCCWGSWSRPPSRCQSSTGPKCRKVATEQPLYCLTEAKCRRYPGQLRISGRQDWALTTPWASLVVQKKEGSPTSCSRLQGPLQPSFPLWIWQTAVDLDRKICFTVAEWSPRCPLNTAAHPLPWGAQAQPCRDTVKLLSSISMWHGCPLVDVPAHPESGDMPWGRHLLWLLGGAVLLHISKDVAPTCWVYRWSETSLRLPGCNKTPKKESIS